MSLSSEEDEEETLLKFTEKIGKYQKLLQKENS